MREWSTSTRPTWSSRERTSLVGMSTIVRAAAKADAQAVGEVLARAFADDPVTTWVTPDAARRARALPRLYSAIARFDSIPFGNAWVAVDRDEDGVVGETITGAAVWRPTHRKASALAIPFSLAAGRALGRDIPRMIVTGTAVARARPKADHWYLQLLGVDPQAQRSGIGSLLMQQALPTVDAAKLPAYLETTVENLEFYARFGFEVTGEISAAADAPTEYSLVRKPER